MTLTTIYKPIRKDLDQVERELAQIVQQYDEQQASELIHYFFDQPGKYLRPALVILSARVVNEQMSVEAEQQLYKLAVAVELVHSASLAHDDIIDGDTHRRGNQTLNARFGNTLAVLFGDMLFSKAFWLVSTFLPVDYSCRVSGLAEEMCLAEITQARSNLQGWTIQTYMDVIAGKTASFMSLCCSLGSNLATQDPQLISRMASYGRNFGMAYQLSDDCADKDSFISKSGEWTQQDQFAELARSDLAEIKASDYKQSLFSLLEFVLSGSHHEK